jgi:peptidoglycan/xylan/chitin deacetylase (PgdA/CDA1 family)
MSDRSPSRAIRQICKLLNPFNNGGNAPLILAYHSVSERRTDTLSLSTENFRHQLQWLQDNGYETLTLRDSVRKNRTQEKVAVLTFDDGYADNYHIVFPLLKEFGMTATIFLVAKSISTDQIFNWDEPKISQQGAREDFEILTWEQIHEMKTYGIEFGSHTCTHRHLPTLSLYEQEREIEDSKEQLEKRLQEAVTSFCYPAGRLTKDTVKLVEQSGYEVGVLTARGQGEPQGKFTLRRVGIYYHVTPLMFRLKVHPFIRQVREPLQELRGCLPL